MRVAGLAIGTLTRRLLVAAVSAEAEGQIHTIHTIYSDRNILQLGKESTKPNDSNRRPRCA